MARDGYVWWYLDVVSDDGGLGLTVIAMLGNVFSPRYAAERRAGPTDPLRHSTMHVALRGRGRDAWSLTERGRMDVQRSRDELVIGPSTMRREGDELVVDFDERTAPFRRPVRGTVRLDLGPSFGRACALDEHGAHRWFPVAPHTRARVEVPTHGVRFEGAAYHDANHGDEPLEARLRSWNWARVATAGGTVVTYDVRARDGAARDLTIAFDARGRAVAAPSLVRAALPTSAWRIARSTRADHREGARLVSTLEDTPFYARSLVDAEVGGQRARGVHEALDLDRFARRDVQFLLPFKMLDAR